MVKRPKTPQHTSKNKKVTTNEPWDQDYYCVFSFKKKPVNKAVIDMYSRELVEWVDDKTNKPFKISQFYLKKGIPYATWKRWLLKYDSLEAANQYAKEQIGNMREYNALTRIFADSMVKPTLGHYCPVWREEQQIQANLNKEQQTTSSDIAAQIAREILRPYE